MAKKGKLLLAFSVEVHRNPGEDLDEDINIRIINRHGEVACEFGAYASFSVGGEFSRWVETTLQPAVMLADG